MKNDNSLLIDGVIDTFPRSVVRPGTIEVQGRTVIASGGSFTENDKDAWLFIPGTQELARIASVKGTNGLILEDSLSVAPGTAYRIVPPNSVTKYIEICPFNVGGVNATIDGVVYAANQGVVTRSGDSTLNRDKYRDPMVIDATGTQVRVTITR